MYNEEGKACVICKEVVSSENTFTKDGWKEFGITQTCESCFDKVTFPVEESFETFVKENKHIIDIVNKHKHCVLAGGALRNVIDPTEEICDYDLFFTDMVDVEKVKEDIMTMDDAKMIFKCPQGELTTYIVDGEKIQLITKKTYKDAQELIDSFDIVACCAAYDGKDFIYHDKFIPAVIHKLLWINTVEYPVATLRRIGKYTAKGYFLSGSESQKVVETINQMELTEDNMEFYLD